MIGEVSGRSATFFVTERHWFRAGNGYSLDSAVVDMMRGKIDRLVFLDSRARKESSVSMQTFLEHSWKTKDFGFGQKVVLDCARYNKPKEPVTEQAPSPAPAEPQGQGQLWAGV